MRQLAILRPNAFGLIGGSTLNDEPPRIPETVEP
jgi:hypothetical protein